MNVYEWARGRQKAHEKAAGRPPSKRDCATPFSRAFYALEAIGQLDTKYGQEVLDQAREETQRLLAAGLITPDQLPGGGR